MSPEVRPIEAGELEAFVWTLEMAAGRALTERARREARVGYEPARTLAAVERGRIVGGTASDRLDLTLPGCTSTGAARITLTAVLPTHRRRGVVTALMCRQVRDLYERGEAVAIFTTSSAGIYHRFGYSPASFAMGIETEPSSGPDGGGDPSGAGLKLLDRREHDAVFPDVFERHRLIQPGQVSRSGAFWRMWLEDHDFYRPDGLSERFGVVFEDSGSIAQGYLTYRLEPGPLREQPVRSLVIEDLVCVTDQARRALWDYCLSFRQAATIKALNIPVDDPVTWTLPDPRSIRVTRLRDFLWVRLVNVCSALAARRYSISASVIFGVHDDVWSANTGRFRLVAGPNGAECTPTSHAPDLELHVRDLAAAYLGGVAFSTLARAGRVDEITPAALDRADALFASHPAAWTVTDW